MSELKPELRRALELALGDATPHYGLRTRVRRALDERLSAATTRRARLRLGFVALAALAIGMLVGTRTVRSTQSVTASNSVLGLRAARAILRAGGELLVERDDESGTRLQLNAGTSLIHVQKGTGRSFELSAGKTRVQVVGTIFGVARQADERVTVEVVEGVVRVIDPSGEHRVTAGQRWPANAASFMTDSELVLLRAPIAVLDSAAPTTPAPTARIEPSAIAEPTPRVEPSAVTATPAVAAPAVAAAKSSGDPSPNDAASEKAQRAYAHAKDLERAGDERGALVAYTALVADASSLAEDALFSILRLHAAHGEPAATQNAISQYRARFPSGRYARDVDVHALNLAAVQADQSAARRECEAFLSHFPNDPRAWRFRLVLARERAGGGNCVGALELLQSVPDSDAKQAVIASCPKRD